MALLLLSVSDRELLGCFFFFSKSLQYLNPTALGYPPDVASGHMMLASVVVLKEHMRITQLNMSITQLISAIMLIGGLLIFFNISLREVYPPDH
nr:hypothetical protein [Sodalis-like endosymbiont of Proechinophthirus fluctus]